MPHKQNVTFPSNIQQTKHLSSVQGAQSIGGLFAPPNQGCAMSLASARAQLTSYPVGMRKLLAVPSSMRIQVKSYLKATRLRGSLLMVVAPLFLVAQLRAQANSTVPNSNSSPSALPAVRSEDHFSWIEQFSGSTNSEGQVMLLDSSAGYLFGRHILVDAGVPVYFVRANTTTSSGVSTTNSFAELGDVYGQVRLSFPNPALNIKTQLTGRAPTGSTSDGISTGHATYDWTNRIDRGFGLWTPFLEAGVANSIPDAFIYRRPFASYGELAHFQAGAAYRVVRWLSAAASAFDVAPWGTQTIDSRIVGKGSGGTGGSGGSGGHGPPFLQGHQTTGASSLAVDNGFSAGVSVSPVRAIDFTAGYSRSTHYHLNIFSFGIAVNMRTLLSRSSF